MDTNLYLFTITTGIGGFVINGETAGDMSGHSVSSAGDVNGDGLADLIVGAPSSDAAAGTDSGRSYVIFGGTAQTVPVNTMGTDGADTLIGTTSPETLVGGDGNDTLIGNGGRDVLYECKGDDIIVLNSSNGIAPPVADRRRHERHGSYRQRVLPYRYGHPLRRNL